MCIFVHFNEIQKYNSERTEINNKYSKYRLRRVIIVVDHKLRSHSNADPPPSV